MRLSRALRWHCDAYHIVGGVSRITGGSDLRQLAGCGRAGKGLSATAAPSAIVGSVFGGSDSFIDQGFAKMKSMFAALAGLIALAGSAFAQTPVAVVEDVQGKVTGAEFMDYVAPGKVIKIGAGGMVVLGYMKSCRRETISSIGTVVVG